MDCQQLIVYGLIILIGLYVLKDLCGVNIEGMTLNAYDANNVNNMNNMVYASDNELEKENFLKVNNLQTDKTSCYPQNSLTPDDLLPKNKSKQIQDFNNQFPVGEGILKGVNFLDAGYHVGVNTIGQSLRNANLGLRSEPANPQVKVSPWMNTTIGPDLQRSPLNDESVCNNNSVPVNDSVPVNNQVVN